LKIIGIYRLLSTIGMEEREKIRALKSLLRSDSPAEVPGANRTQIATE
jgi:hypothetical protein